MTCLIYYYKAESLGCSHLWQTYVTHLNLYVRFLQIHMLQDTLIMNMN